MELEYEGIKGVCAGGVRWPISAYESEAWLMTSQAATNAAEVPAHLVEALAATPGADDWQCTLRRDDEAQMYLIGTRIEAVRQVNSTQAQAVLYSDHPPASGEDASLARGSTAATLSGGELADPARLAARLEDGVAMARLIDNPPFALPTMPAG